MDDDMLCRIGCISFVVLLKYQAISQGLKRSTEEDQWGQQAMNESTPRSVSKI